MSIQLSKKTKGLSNLILKTWLCNLYYRLPFVSRIWRVHSLFSDVISDPGSHRGVEFNLRKFRLKNLRISFAYEFKFLQEIVCRWCQYCSKLTNYFHRHCRSRRGHLSEFQIIQAYPQSNIEYVVISSSVSIRLFYEKNSRTSRHCTKKKIRLNYVIIIVYYSGRSYTVCNAHTFKHLWKYCPHLIC